MFTVPTIGFFEVAILLFILAAVWAFITFVVPLLFE